MNKLTSTTIRSRTFGNVVEVIFKFDDASHAFTVENGMTRAAVALKLQEVAKVMNNIRERPAEVSPWAAPPS